MSSHNRTFLLGALQAAMHLSADQQVRPHLADRRDERGTAHIVQRSLRAAVNLGMLHEAMLFPPEELGLSLHRLKI